MSCIPTVSNSDIYSRYNVLSEKTVQILKRVYICLQNVRECNVHIWQREPWGEARETALTASWQNFLHCRNHYIIALHYWGVPHVQCAGYKNCPNSLTWTKNSSRRVDRSAAFRLWKLSNGDSLFPVDPLFSGFSLVVFPSCHFHRFCLRTSHEVWYSVNIALVLS